MNLLVPDDQVFGSALVSGWVQNGGPETLRMTVVLKTAYDIVENGAAPRVLVPAVEEERAEIVYADDGALIDVDGTPTFDVSYEADIALEKARADVVVLGYMPDAAETLVDGTVRIDNVGWLSRNAVERTRDSARNLFGFQPRMKVSRKIAVASDFIPSEGNLLPPSYSRSFNNFHRRGIGFTFVAAEQLPSGGLVEVNRTIDQSDTAYSFILPDLDLTARYRHHNGVMSDHAHCWHTTELGQVPADTLIVSPDDNHATIVWRTGWVADAQAFDAYRRVEISRGAV